MPAKAKMAKRQRLNPIKLCFRSQTFAMKVETWAKNSNIIQLPSLKAKIAFKNIKKCP
jgi:hypothetical protein